MRAGWRLLFIVLLPTYGCTAAQISAPSPAVIENGDANGHRQLSLSIAELLNLKKVNLAKNAFTSNNVVIIHRANLTGRDLSVPDKFKLELINNKCVLTHLNSKKTQTLSGLVCGRHAH